MIEVRVIIVFVVRKYIFFKVGLGELERNEKGVFIFELI